MLGLMVLAGGLAFAPGARAHAGFGMVVDKQGRVIFLDSTRSRVWRIESDGKLTELASGKHGNTLAQDTHGNLYFQNFNQTLWKLTPDGILTQVKMPAREGTRGAIGSLDELIAVDGDGNLYVSSGNDFYQRSPQILKITPQGEVLLLAGSAPGNADGRGREARFTHIRSAAWGPDGALYIADGRRVRRVTLDGEVTTVAGTLRARSDDAPTALENGPWLRNDNPKEFGRLLGIALDEQGNIFVADPDNFRICRIGKDSSLTTIHRTGLPFKPAGVAVSAGNVYVIELKFVPLPLIADWFDTHRVRRIAPDGSATTVATVGGGGGYIVAAFVAAIALGSWRLQRRHRRKKEAKAIPIVAQVRG